MKLKLLALIAILAFVLIAPVAHSGGPPIKGDDHPWGGNARSIDPDGGGWGGGYSSAMRTATPPGSKDEGGWAGASPRTQLATATPPGHTWLPNFGAIIGWLFDTGWAGGGQYVSRNAY